MLNVQGGINTCDCTQDIGSMGPWICKIFLCKGCLSDVGVDSGCAVDVNIRTKRSCNPILGQKFTSTKTWDMPDVLTAPKMSGHISDVVWRLRIPTLATKDTVP